MNPSNQISVIGNIGEEPEFRTKTRSGDSVVTLSVAQNVTGLDPKSGERVLREPQWLRVTCFGSLGDRVLANAKKGDLVLVAGELKSRSYEEKAGTKRVAFEIVAAEVLKVERLRLPRENKVTDAAVSPEDCLEAGCGEEVGQ